MPIKTSRFEADIILQSLGELITRNKYGSFKSFSEDYTSGLSGPYGAFSLRLSVSGKGIIYGGKVKFSGGADSKYGSVWLTYDLTSTEQILLTCSDLIDHNIVVPGLTDVFITRYDPVNNIFVVGFTPGITFESSFHLRINTGGSYINAYTDLWYATV